MVVWFSPNMGLNFGHWDYFLDSPGLGFEGWYPSRFWFRDKWKCRDFSCELFFRTVLGPSFKTS